MRLTLATLTEGMTRTSAKPEGVWRALQLAVSPFTFAAKVAAAVFLVLAVIAGGLIWGLHTWLSSPRNTEPPPEVRELISRLTTVAPFQGITPKASCELRRRALLAAMPAESCLFDFGKTSVRVSWHPPIGQVWAVALQTSIRDEQRTAYQSASLDWLDFAEIHRMFCPKGSDTAVVMTTLPQRLGQLPWSRWDGGKTVPAKPDELGASRSVKTAKSDGCNMRLTETRGRDQLQVTLAFPVPGQGL